MLRTSMNINNVKRGYIFTFWGRYFLKVSLWTFVRNTPCFSLLSPFTPDFWFFFRLKKTFYLFNASFSWQIICFFISSFLVYEAFAAYFHSSISNVRNCYILFCFSLIPLKAWVKGVLAILHYTNGTKTFMEIVWY